MQKKKALLHEELYGDYGRAFNFTQGDLEANRAGFISKRQADAVKAKTLSEIIGMQIPTTLFVAMTALFFYSIFRAGWLMLFCVVPFSIFALLFIVMSIWKFLSMHQDLAERRIETADCYKREIANAKNLSDYYLQNEKKSFKLTAAQFGLLGTNVYRVYYTTRSRDILAIEEVVVGDETSEEILEGSDAKEKSQS